MGDLSHAPRFGAWALEKTAGKGANRGLKNNDAPPASSTRGHPASAILARGQAWLDAIAPAPWQSSIGARHPHRPPHTPSVPARAPLYTPEQRQRRDQSVWTLVQAILAPVQFLVFLISAGLIIAALNTGRGYDIAQASVVIKTMTLYAIMITGSIWEKDVFGKWLFAAPFFWEDVFSMLVLALHTAYLIAVLAHIGSPQAQLLLALAAYATYAINAGQFLWKLRLARLEGAPSQRARAT